MHTQVCLWSIVNYITGLLQLFNDRSNNNNFLMVDAIIILLLYLQLLYTGSEIYMESTIDQRHTCVCIELMHSAKVRWSFAEVWLGPLKN